MRGAALLTDVEDRAGSKQIKQLFQLPGTSLEVQSKTIHLEDRGHQAPDDIRCNSRNNAIHVTGTNRASACSIFDPSRLALVLVVAARPVGDDAGPLGQPEFISC